MALSRNQEHKVIMTVIYDELTDHIYGDKSYRDPKMLIEEVSETPYDEVSEFVKDVVYTSLQKYPDIVKAYEPFLINWRWERIPTITKAILVMSYSHFYYVEKVEKRIVINIAVNLAKEYIEEKQAKFINGILDKVLKE